MCFKHCGGVISLCQQAIQLSGAFILPETRKNEDRGTDFDSLFSDSLCLIVSNVIYGPFFTIKNPLSTNKSLTTPIFYSLQAFAPIPQPYFSKYWGEPMHGPSLHLKFLGGPSPQSLLGLRPCICDRLRVRY